VASNLRRLVSQREDGGIKFPRNVGNDLPYYTKSYPGLYTSHIRLRKDLTPRVPVLSDEQ
jgi:hypothetical protein